MFVIVENLIGFSKHLKRKLADNVSSVGGGGFYVH
jgi:hypothetical protein